ncbi:MAG TPA: ABC transporter substrate-binding protein [Geminicoccaceae bacterium]|nr:ABC transporter substrate-binding protein [Geminicoccus sp.]HMU53005.1 ABC transporter substrate-binding protein [Geminicoccaceae bacterium]
MRSRKATWAAALLAGALLAGTAWAQEITIGRGNEPDAIDPHFSRTGNNQMTAVNMFDRLLLTTPQMSEVPALAVSWRNIDPLTWEVKLRQGVTFHDGSPFTAEDVLFSFERTRSIPNSPASFASSVASVKTAEIVDPLTIRFTTDTPTPQFVTEIGRIYIASKKAAEGATTEDFNSGKATIGTGPYKFVEWVPADRVVLERNDSYWGEKPAYQKATLKFISNDAARVAALLSGSVDLIDLVPPTDVETLKANPDIQLFSTASSRLIYIGVDSDRDESPFVTDVDGRPMDRNPLKDSRVRLALSKMIDRGAIVDRILYGSGTPAGQLVPEGLFGFNPDLKPVAADPQGAKALLAEAGWGQGFGLTVHGSNDRFSYDGQVAQAIGQLLARGGIKINKVDAQPYSVYAKAATNREFSFFVFSFGSSTGEASAGLNSVLHTFDKEGGMGANNRARYSNPEFDKVLQEALQEFDDGRREKLLQQAAAIAFGDTAIIPLYWQEVYWAGRKGVTYDARRDERTIVYDARPAP